MTGSTWIVVPCQRSRLPLLATALKSLEHPPDRVVVVATLPDPLTPVDLRGRANHVLLHEAPERHITRWWNRGLDHVRSLVAEGDRYEVFGISSDIAGTRDDVPKLRTFMRDNDLAMVGPNYFGSRDRFFRNGEPRTVFDRVPGVNWMIAGETGIRLDTEFRWWYDADDLEMQARTHSRTGITPTTISPGDDTPLSDEKQRWAIEDRQKFVEKWGVEPW